MTYDVITRARHNTRRRILAIFLVAATVAGALTVAVVFGTGPSRPVTTQGRPAAPAATDTTAGAAGGASGGLPSDLDWSDVAGVSVPVSNQSGPRLTENGLASGFAHDRAGAVLAAVHIVVRVNPQVGPAVFEPALRTQVVGRDAPALRVQVVQAYDALRFQAGMAYGQPIGTLYATLRGYRILSYTEAEASLRLLIEAPGASGAPVIASTEVHLRWTGSDWALLAPTGGTFDRAVTAASAADIATFLPFTAGG
ncbi:hypothetical protein [Micromonospora globbae]|uniref:DUF8175 domain-containing protein n=1 Tax=Micromonospora globbae TaxID=1894969 RepID=A0A420EVD8_9ACTN|nr:hypothetical protein [Micromonospora globbae]RKF24649.1 hypothetical protein D7I43_25050 [Micromonospora globbae]